MIIAKPIAKQKLLKCTSRKTNIKERKIGNYKLQKAAIMQVVL